MLSKSRCLPHVVTLFASLVVALPMLCAAVRAETQSLETLLAYLKSPNADTRRDAARKLGERREHKQLVVEALVAAARKDEAPEVRTEAVKSLGFIKDFSALPDMISAVKDSNTEVRRIALRSLVALYTEHDIEFITNLRSGWNLFNPFLDTSDHEIIEPYVVVDPTIITAIGDAARGDRERTVRIAAIRSLGVLRGAGAISQLSEALNADQDIRIEVLRAFIKIGDPSAGGHLIPFFRDSDQRVRTQAMFASGMLKYRAAVEPLLSVYGLGPEKLGTMSKVTGKVKGAFSYRPPRDEAALWALSLIGDDRAEQVLVENIDSNDADRRQYAMEGLGRIADPRYLDQISRAIIKEGNSDVKLAEYFAMYRMGSRANIQFIVNKLDTDQEQQARTYLMEAKPADLYPFIRSSSRVISQRVIEVLGRIGDQETAKELKPIAETSGKDTSNAATVAMKRIEWRLAGRPRANDAVLRSERPRRAGNP